MPWQTPTLKEVRSIVRDNIRGSLPGADASIPNSVLRVMSDNQGGLCHLTLQFIDWLALQLIPDTAEAEWLDRHGDIWLVNANGSTGRKMATHSSGTATFTSLIPGVVLPALTPVAYGQDQSLMFETTEVAIIGGPVETPVAIRCLDPGSVGNLETGTAVAIVDGPPEMVREGFVVDLTGGTDEESDDDLRARVLRRIRQPPMGGAQHDYEAWALAVPGVTRAWCGSCEMGMGTVTIRFLMDDLRAANDGWPTAADIAAVDAYINIMRPVAVKDYFVVAPIKQRVDAVISSLVPDNAETRAAIEASLRTMLRQVAAPGQTIYAAWKSYAIMNAAGVQSFNLRNPLDDLMQSPGHMAVLGDITYV
jgi:uncharacterized phage protein gp47/JayE